MKKEVYLVQSCPRDEFRKAAKNGTKCDVMGLHGRILPMWATSSKKEAIQDCREHNRLTSDVTIFFINPIYLYN